MLLIALSVGATAWSEFMKNDSATNLLFIQSILPDGEHYVLRLPDVTHGQLWRLITPIFLHGSWLHIAMNMYMLFVLGGSVESAKGSWKYAGLVLVMAAASNFGQYVASGPRFGGMSGVDFGLFGYLWMKSRYAPEEGFFMPQHVVVQAMIWMGLCIVGFIPHIANTAHTVGLVTGMFVAVAPVVYRHLMR
jgi:GlpG protein